MDLQPDFSKPLYNGLFPAPQLSFAVAEQCKIIHVTQEGGTAQLTLNKVVKRV
jgi:hypothetical protein